MRSFFFFFKFGVPVATVKLGRRNNSTAPRFFFFFLPIPREAAHRACLGIGFGFCCKENVGVSLVSVFLELGGACLMNERSSRYW